ncbi:putative oxidoreductase [Gordonia rhizosphera NBRC 16068]|uniref:Putative oxidoreductase n=1 Tax=Gordonia rhizosphera NBRC 16068 TaxID=1108045 RepID=K6VZP4_9ACTN|nr:putative oxidoreductase [Gordonia rhizosphera NBRC 16068]
MQGHPEQSVYNISKGAAANLTRILAIEYGQNKIRVNGICPTYAKTALTRALFDDKDFDTTFTESIPLKTVGRGRRHRQPRPIPRLRRVELPPRRPHQGRRRRNPLPLFGVTNPPE